MTSPELHRRLQVIMVCAAGMSSSLVETHIRQAAETAGLRLELRSMSALELEHWDFENRRVDAVLVAPQVRFLRKNLARRVEPHAIPVVLIEPMHFGMADGEAILSQLRAALAPSAGAE